MQANESQNAYKNWKSQNPGISDGISYLGWLTSTAFGGNAYNEGLIEAQADYDKQRAFVAKLFTIASQPLVDAITNASAAQFTTNYVPPGGSTAIALPATTIHPDLSTAVSNWDQAPANIYQLDKTFTKDTVYTSPWSEHVQVSNTYLFDSAFFERHLRCKGVLSSAT